MSASDEAACRKEVKRKDEHGSEFLLFSPRALALLSGK